MSKRSRKSVQYSQRKLRKHLDGDVRVECATTAEDVARFVSDATAVSRKSYQWHLLGLGLRDAQALTATLTAAAERGSGA